MRLLEESCYKSEVAKRVAKLKESQPYFLL